MPRSRPSPTKIATLIVVVTLLVSGLAVVLQAPSAEAHVAGCGADWSGSSGDCTFSDTSSGSHEVVVSGTGSAGVSVTLSGPSGTVLTCTGSVECRNTVTATLTPGSHTCAVSGSGPGTYRCEVASAGVTLAGTAVAMTAVADIWVSPGLSLTPSPQNTQMAMNLMSTGLVTGGPVVAGVSACQATAGSLVAETSAHGVGTGAWECVSGPFAGSSGSLTYARATGVLVLDFTGDLIGRLHCSVVPTSGDGVTVPITGLQAACLGAAAVP